MTKPFFSIVIPTLNEEVALPELLLNLKNQTFGDFEVVVVDAGSQDKTREKAFKFQEDLALSFTNAKKKNVSYQRNMGAKMSKASYIIFLDADTKIPNAFLKTIKEAVKKSSPDFLTTWIKTTEKGMKPIEAGTNLIFEMSKSVGSPGLYGSMLLVKKTSFEKVHGFNEKLGFKEDSDLALRMYKQGYKYIILKNTYYFWSLRRFERLGTLKTLQNYLLLHLSKDLDYPMGGRILTKTDVSKFNKFVNEMRLKFKLE